ncbi:hypothetical protein FZC33_13070 [Labrys sp. KNU-23]|uniref:hypothetical protein n=1 Tax=Labrys sp. KNU-23 TaxID=2789216 RepID=UPI0011F08CEF|nr:hypothetical protein [Labrys sp. KNU-23]QEN87202.1 hypothetical protein FZC33_13070 [Labrys sp. KNU-23]
MRVLFILFWFTAFAQAAYAQNIAEYPILRWGMTKAEVKAAYPAMADGVSHYDPGKRAMVESFGQAKARFAGCDTTFHLTFGREERLQQAGFSRLKSREDGCALAFQLELSRRFGPNYLSAAGTLFGPVNASRVVTVDSWTSATWVLPSGLINFTNDPHQLMVTFARNVP